MLTIIKNYFYGKDIVFGGKMSRITKHFRKLKLTFVSSIGCVVVGIAVFYPWFNIENINDSYYVVEINGKEVGTVENQKDADKALLAARKKLEIENNENVYTNYDVNVVEKTSVAAKIDSLDKVTENIYTNLSDSVVETKVLAYTINIDGNTITLSSKEDVEKLLNSAKSKFDTNNDFSTVLTVDNASRGNAISYEMVSAQTSLHQLDQVFASGEGIETEAVQESYFEIPDHILDIKYEEDITITQAYVSSSQITNVDEAIAEVTKEKEEAEIYTVENGDSFYAIAEKFSLTMDELFAMNVDYDINSVIRPGDTLIVTVPQSDLSVIVNEQRTYEEEYNLPINYVYNDSKYTTYSNVVEEGVAGKRKVVANVTSKNGVEINREIVLEDIISEAKAATVEVGTKTPPTYIKPISGGIISDPFGMRWGRLHAGIDWATRTGTTVVAARGGVVTQAGWAGSYGYCVVITHSDGHITRYAHLSQVDVTYGQEVAQGQRIGLSGNTGYSTGPHLHFEIIMYGTPVNPLDHIN